MNIHQHNGSDIEEDADERYFFHDEEWENDDDDDDDDSAGFDLMDPQDNEAEHISSPAHELDGEMINWYARSHERYIKNIINGDPVEDYGLSIPPAPVVAAANDEADINDNAADRQRAEDDFRRSLDTGPILVDSTRGEGVSCELKSEVSMTHDGSFVPHWLNYTDALKSCRILRLFQEFSVNKIHLHSAVSSMIMSSLLGKHLRKLSLFETNLCSTGFSCLADFLRRNTTLESLTLDKNIIDDSVDTEEFSKALRNHAQLEYLSLCECQLGYNVNALSDMLHAGMKELRLGSNKIGTQSGFIIASFLSSNPPTIVNLNLERNEFDDGDIIHFASSLRTNTRLRQLTLSANKFSIVGVKSIFKEIFNPTTLNAVADCNHTCTLHLFTKFFNPIQRINSEDELINKRNKILLALRIVDSQLQYFDGVPLELMPFVLRQIQQEKALTRVFSCVKDFIVQSMETVSLPQKKPSRRSKRKRAGA